MSEIKSISNALSKLSKVATTLSKNQQVEKTGLLTSNDKTTYYQTKSFRLRQQDSSNFRKIATIVNEASKRKKYADSQIIRGIINYVADDIDNNLKHIRAYIDNSS